MVSFLFHSSFYSIPLLLWVLGGKDPRWEHVHSGSCHVRGQVHWLLLHHLPVVRLSLWDTRGVHIEPIHGCCCDLCQGEITFCYLLMKYWYVNWKLVEQCSRRNASHPHWPGGRGSFWFWQGSWRADWWYPQGSTRIHGPRLQSIQLCWVCGLSPVCFIPLLLWQKDVKK